MLCGQELVASFMPKSRKSEFENSKKININRK